MSLPSNYPGRRLHGKTNHGHGGGDNDILLYFPIFDRYADYGRGMLEHFDAISPAYNGTPFKTGAETMIEKGYSFDYISDLQIKNTMVSLFPEL